MSFELVAEKIVRNSIRTAYAIDDEFVEPYTKQRGNKEISKELFSSFRKAGCSLELARFSNKRKWEKEQKLNLGKKDLLILDWELNKGGIKFKSALRILDQAVQESGLPFICIYTHVPNLDEVAQNVFSYFWYSQAQQNIIKEAIDSFIDTLEERIEDFDENVFVKIAEKILELIKQPLKEKELLKEIKRGIHEKFGQNAKSAIESAGNEFFKRPELKDILTYFVLGNQKYLKSGKKKQDNRILPVQSSECPYSFLINNALVHIFQKTGTAPVKPDQLYSILSKAIYNRPNNFVSLLGLEFRNHFRDKAKNLGRELNAINEDAFFYHQTCVEGNGDSGEQFSFFMKDIWNSQVVGDWHAHTPETLKVIESYKTKINFEQQLNKIKEDKGNNIKNDLARLNKRYSILNWEPKPPSSLRFGDIFKTSCLDIPYLLCITSHCDCFRPEKIKNHFLFVAGKEKNLKSGLLTGEDGFQSFINGPNDGVLCIEWEGKPFSLHIDSARLNLKKPLKVKYKQQNIQIDFLCTQKENYTQRVANFAFGNAGRVGITIANLHEFKGSEST
ncbi:MAG: response regulator receiver domain [Proteobacteria bacterium]|nr:response regulator receiver domain [Pseudomonadota bacterium]